MGPSRNDTARVSASAAQERPRPATLAVTGTLADGTAFVGHLSQLSTSVENGVLMLFATMTGQQLPDHGARIMAPVRQLTAGQGCTVLTIDVGPSNVPDLGSVVDLNRIELTGTVVPGAGAVYGNPLSATALEGDGPLEGIATLLNRLLNDHRR